MKMMVRIGGLFAARSPPFSDLDLRQREAERDDRERGRERLGFLGRMEFEGWFRFCLDCCWAHIGLAQ
jgi:hypothetical protein